MNKWNLPTSINVMGVSWDIRTSYQLVLDVISFFNSPDYDVEEKILYCLMSMIVDFDNMPMEEYGEAYKQLIEFIDMGESDKSKNKKPKPKVMDWDKDASMICAEINKQLGGGLDVRGMSDMHWWTFLGHYMAIGECSYTRIISIRSKRANGKKLEKWEQDYVIENKDLFVFENELTQEEKEEEERLALIFG